MRGHKYPYTLESVKCAAALLWMKLGLYRGLPEHRLKHLGMPQIEPGRLGVIPREAADAIPAVCFQTWKSRTDIPANFNYWRASVLRRNPGWTFVLTDDADNRAFIARSFPWFLPTYDAFPREIYRADAVRPFLLVAFGGMYLDMDVECLKPIRLDGSQGVVLGAMGRDMSLPYAVPNAMMASRPNQLFWALFLSHLIRQARAPGAATTDPEDVTGPNVLKLAVEEYRAADEAAIRRDHADVVAAIEDSLGRRLVAGPLDIRPAHEWYPFNWDDPIQKRLRWTMMASRRVLGPRLVRWLFPRSTFVTYWTHSW